MSVGKPHERHLKEGVEDYTNRINKYFKSEWVLLQPKNNAPSLPENLLKKMEADLILQQVKSTDFLILLDEKGKQFSSPELASLIQQRANESTRQLIFLIGGAFGADESVIKRANLTWSLSKLVFPHMLVRLILSEQIYRACTIIRNEKYHHS